MQEQLLLGEGVLSARCFLEHGAGRRDADHHGQLRRRTQSGAPEYSLPRPSPTPGAVLAKYCAASMLHPVVRSGGLRVQPGAELVTALGPAAGEPAPLLGSCAAILLIGAFYTAFRIMVSASHSAQPGGGGDPLTAPA